jgi:hypothetical protein
MGILDNFIKTIRGQRKEYRDEQRKAEMEKAARENEARVKAAKEREAAEAEKKRTVLEKAARENEAKLKAAREREYMGQAKGSEYGALGGVVDRIKEQRREFEEAQKKGAGAAKGGTQTVQEARVPAAAAPITQFGRTFIHKPELPAHVFIDDAAKSVYIDDIDGFMNAGGKVERGGMTAEMDPDLYDIYTKKGGPLGQARYLRSKNKVISLVPDPFAKYR